LLTILTTVLTDTKDLLNTYNYLKPILSNDLKWFIKFSNHVSHDFINEFMGPNVILHQQTDSSLYEGLNQALPHISSEYYLVVGAGDEIIANNVLKLLQLIKLGSITSHIFTPAYKGTYDEIYQAKPERMQFEMCTPHPGAILKVKESIAIGGYDSSYKIASDYDHLSKYIKKYGLGTTLDIICVNALPGGISYTKMLEGLLECEIIKKRVWDATDIEVKANLLALSAGSAINLMRQIKLSN
jgi:hypothetical protein